MTLKVKALDWDDEELEDVMFNGLKYTVRSSKYPRTLKNPHRTVLILNNRYAWSAHTVLITRFSTHFSSLLKADPTSQVIHINNPNPHISLGAWYIFLTWLYKFDKIPLQDFTPLRDPSWRTRDIKSACQLASFLKAPVFEKYLLRIIMKELHEDCFPEVYIEELAESMPPSTGMYHFASSWVRWRDAGWAGELDPMRWRVEHWYAICGRGGNWGCFHAMNVSGWGGVWERQKALGEVGDMTSSDEDWY